MGNFSSPHSFKFVDGSILPRVDPDIVKLLTLDVEEQDYNIRRIKNSLFTTVKLIWATTEVFMDHVVDIHEEYKRENIDICLMPLPGMVALKEMWSVKEIIYSPFRVIRVADRETKEIFIDKFCV